METAGLLLVIALTLAFNYTNGFHDAANAIATSVSTRALTPRAALVLAAAMNLCGAFLGQGVAKTVTSGIIDAPDGAAGLQVLFAAVVGALVWNLVTWWFGLPSSSSHALFGGMVGAALAASASVHWNGVVDKIVLPMVISPLVGGIGGYLVMVVILWAFRHAAPRNVTRGFRIAQTCSAAGMALGHGLQDAQKAMGVIVLALIVTGHHQGTSVPVWVTLISALVMSFGTYSGGWRVMRTLGRRIVELDPPRGFAAEVTSSAVLYTTAFGFQAPISTTHVITAAVAGAGATRRVSAVRWGVASRIVVAWVLTLPASALVGALMYELARTATG